MKIVAVITTHRRRELLIRTLKSVQNAKIPPDLQCIYILENDTQPCSDVSSEFPDLPTAYRFFPQANKSRALNWLLPELADSLIVFLDDDVLVPACLFSRYSDAFQRTLLRRELGPDIAFWGGAVVPEFEESPPSWLLRKLPRSVIGWNLGENSMVVKKPDFLGCNWAVSAEALLRSQGFDESRGPGTNTISIGQESSAQVRLLHAGYRGFYMPGPPVQHYVPADRCTPEWALQRAEKNGRGFGMSYAARLGKWIYWPALLRLWWAEVRCSGVADLSREQDFLHLYDVRRWSGFAEGVRSMS